MAKAYEAPGVAAAETPTAEAASHSPAAAKFLEGDLRGHVISMSAAGSVGLMAIFVVDLADLFFISLLGEAALAAAVGYAAAVAFFVTSLSIGMAIAIGALTARALGAGDPVRARLYASTSLAVAIALMSGVAALVWAFATPLVGMVGAEGETERLAARYLAIVAPSLPLLTCMMAAGAILRAHGDARRSMVTTVSAAVANGVLDPIFIFALGLGLDGAALATVAARFVGASVGFAPILRHYGGFAPVTAEAVRADAPAIAGLAGPAMLTNLATPVGAAFVTRLTAEFGDGAVAGYAIIGRLTPVAFAAVFALSGAIGPIVGQNFGAARWDRVRETLTASMKVLAVYVLAVSALLYLGSGWVIAAFSAQGDAALLILWFCGPLSLLFYFNGLLFASNAAFNNLGRPFLSTSINWARHTVGTIPFALAGVALLDAPGALVGQAVGGVVFGVFAIWRAQRLTDVLEERARGVGRS